MAYYQNIFTQVQVRPLEPERRVPVAVDDRVGKPFNSLPDDTFNVGPDDVPVPVFATTALHARAAVDLALS